MPIELRPFRSGDRPSVIALWRDSDLVRPWNDPDRDIDRKLAHDPERFVVAEDAGTVVGCVMVGYDGHRGWINYLAVDPSRRHQGLGRLLMAEAERLLTSCGCAKINLQVRRTNPAAVSFYERLGYTVDDSVSLGRRLVDDDPGPEG